MGPVRDRGRKLNLNGPSRSIASGRRKRKPVVDFLKRQGRFAHFTDEDVDYFQAKVDQMWEKWWLPGVIPMNPDEALERL